MSFLSSFAPSGAPRASAARELAGVVVAATLLLPACSSTADDEDAALDSGVAGDFDDGDSGADDGAGDTAGGVPPGGDTDEPEPDDADGDSDGDDGGGGPDDSPESMVEPLPPSCGEMWPRGWVFCEDFEAIKDPLDSFAEYANADGAFVWDEAVGAMRADYAEGVENAGWILASFGASPIAHSGGTSPAAERHFEEVYWRFRVRHQAGWPDVGPGWMSRVTAYASDNWAEALVAQLRSPMDGTTVEAVPLTCVSGESVTCDGYNDESALQPLETLGGSTELFSSSLSGEWHCVEAHVRLNTPGASDGVLEFWIDGNQENARDDVDWRGGWGEYGLNALTLENFWPGGAPQDLSRWIDDVVISSDPIGCE